MELEEDDEILQELDNSVDNYDQHTENKYDDGIANSCIEDPDEDEDDWDPIWEDDPAKLKTRKTMDDMDDFDDVED